jgi:hypothetical protein
MMTSWCLYCGYDDAYVIPQLVKSLPNVTLDIVDISPQGGIADHGPKNPPFSGHDGTGSPITTAGMEKVMTQYAQTYHIPASVHVYVATSATRTAWAVTAYPTWVFANALGTVTKVDPGAMTIPASVAIVQAAIS